MNLRVLLLCAICVATPSQATDVTLIGLFPGKAVITINRGSPRTLSLGEKTAEGVQLVSTDAKGAVLEIDGARQKLEMGQHFETAPDTSMRQSVTLSRDASGHFYTDAQVNGTHLRLMVDTGATLVSIPLAEALRLGIEYSKGTPGYSVLADGRRVASWRVMLATVTVGDLTLFNVEGSVSQGTGVALLGMSFLGRTELRYEGLNLTLTKRY
jgi:aspartyl protease family protein